MKSIQKIDESLLAEDSVRNPARKSGWWRHPLWPTLFLLLLACNLVVIGFDLYPRIAQKIGRNQIGSLTLAEMRERVRKATIRLLDTHTAPLNSDESRLVIIDYLREHSDFPYRGGLLTSGLITQCELTNDPEAFLSIQRYCDTLIDEKGRFFDPPNSVNDGVQGCALAFVAQRASKPNYRVGADALYTYYANIALSHDGLVPYVRTKQDNLVLVDTIGLLDPFLARYSLLASNPAAMTLAIRQIDDFMVHGIEHNSELPFHGYNLSEHFSPVGVVGWGRGLGWLASGISRVAQEMQTNDPNFDRLVDYTKELTSVAKRYQRPDGGWGVMLSYQSAELDSSATAMITGFLLRSQRTGKLGPEYDDTIKRALECLRKCTRVDGQLDFAQGDVLDLNRHSRNWGLANYGQGNLLSCMAMVEHLDERRKRDSNEHCIKQ